MTGDQLLAVENLHTRFDTPGGTLHAVNGVTFDVREGEIVGIVGESGCGKSVTALSIMRLEEPGRITRGSIRFRDTELTTAADRTIRDVRGTGMAMVFQDPMTTLNPTFTVSEQIAEALKIHDDPADQRLLDYLRVPGFSDRADWADKQRRAIDLMAEVGIPNPGERVDAYPHEFSGGMRQRAMIAIALAREPDLLIADEPTTALDVTIQAQILDMIRDLNADLGMGVVMISHDLGVIAELCDRVLVMYGGEIMESGPLEEVLTAPRHPYTRALLRCMPQTTPPKHRLNVIEGEVPDLVGGVDGCPFAPRCEYAREECRNGEMPTVAVGDDVHAKCCRLDAIQEKTASGGKAASNRRVDPAPGDDTRTPKPAPVNNADYASPVVELEHVSKRFALDDSLLARLTGTRTFVRAVTDVSLTVYEGETLGLVGESGSGKSTLANLIAGLYTPTSGDVRIDGENVGHATNRSSDLLADVGVVFQNPRASLNPRMSVEEVVAEPLRTRGWNREHRAARVAELIDLVELSPAHLGRYPHELSGGQAQRVALARALALDPRVLILDEPVTALDVSVQAKILNVLSDLQADLGLTYLLVAHDLSVVEHVADRVAVMYLGRVMEVAPPDRLFGTPAHPYTAALLSAIPNVDPTADTDERIILDGEVPSPVNPPTGCVFHTRCPAAEEKCSTTDPPVKRVEEAESRCHFAGDF